MFDTDPTDPADPVERFVQVARQVQRAASVQAIARTVIAALPGCDDVLRAAIESCLTSLELSLAQCTAASLEQAHDLRLNTRRQLTRLLGMHAEAELAASLAEVAVQAVAALSSTRAITDAAAEATPEAVAFAGMSGAVFVSARARQLAADHGLAPAGLESLLLAAVLPIRNACATAGISAVGELRYRASAGTLAASARLDRSREGAPLIHILLHKADQPPAEETAVTQRAPYAAHVLRRLVS